MLRRVTLVRTDISEELSAYIMRVTRIGELGTTLAVTRNRRTLRRNTCSIVPPKRQFSQEGHCITFQKTAFFTALSIVPKPVSYSRGLVLWTEFSGDCRARRNLDSVQSNETFVFLEWIQDGYKFSCVGNDRCCGLRAVLCIWRRHYVSNEPKQWLL
jgi:hypothetical protein